MYKITKKYEDFLGREVEETFRFNITESEMVDMIKKDPSFNPDRLLYYSKEPDGIELIDVIRKILVISYGELSDDAKHFWKDDKKTTDFVQSAAYDEILNDFLDGEHIEFVKEFIVNVFPKKYRETIKKQTESAGTNIVPVSK